jgi:phosphate:Na+ symporter
VLSDLKRIHSHICSVAYPVLEAAGELPLRESVKSDAATDTLSYQPKLP